MITDKQIIKMAIYHDKFRLFFRYDIGENIMSQQRVVIVRGSPRTNGNSNILADSLAKGAKDSYAEVNDFFLQKMDIKPCNACDVCIKKPERGCVIDDDMQIIYPKLRAADSIVIASPIYWFNMSGQTKLFIDRFYALIEPKKHALKEKRIGIILTYGDTNEHSSGAINAINSFKDTFRYIGAKIVGIIHGTAMDAGEITKNKELIEDAYELGVELGKPNPGTI